MEHKQKILINGAGPAGLALAILLDKNRYDVHVVERADSFRSMGFSIILWKSGFNILSKVLNTHSVPGCYPLENFHIIGGNDFRILRSVDTAELGHSIQREDLIQQLSQKYLDTWGHNQCRFSIWATNIQQDDTHAHVTFSDGSTDSYDWVIDAEGMHSTLRQQLLTYESRMMPYKIHYVKIKPGSQLHNEAIIGFLKDYVYLIQTTGEDALLAYYSRLGSQDDLHFVQSLKQNIESFRNGSFDLDEESHTIFDSEKVTLKKCYAGRFISIGDSYHGHPPTLALGTSMALEDASILADLLNQNQTSPQTVTKSFSRIRNKRIKKVYSTQDWVEKMSITNNTGRIALTKLIVTHGGWPLIERRLLACFK